MFLLYFLFFVAFAVVGRQIVRTTFSKHTHTDTETKRSYASLTDATPHHTTYAHIK